MADMEIYLEADGESFRLPIVPAAIETTFETGNQVQRVHTFGEVFIFGRRGARTIVLESWWPDPKNDYGFLACRPPFKPYKFVTKINAWKDKIIKLTITGTNIKGMPCGYTTFTHSEEDASGDIKYSLTLVEYRKPVYTFTKKLKAMPIKKGSTKVVEALTERPAKSISGTYVVKEGDCLETIAKAQTGNSGNWEAIYNANKDLIEATAKKYGKSSSNNGWWIYPGTRLVIPK